MRLLILAVIGLSLGTIQTGYGQIVVSMDRYALLAELYDQSGEEVDMYGIISNEGATSASLTCRLDYNHPDPWLAPGICVGQSCYPSGIDFPLTLQPGAEDTLHMTFYPFTEPGKGIYTFHVSGVGDPFSVEMEILAGSSSILVDDDGGDAYEVFISNALAPENQFLTWHQTVEPLNMADLALIERIVWITGTETGDVLDEQEVDVLGAFLDNGGKAILSGENILDGSVAADFGREMLGAEVSDASVDSRTIQAITGEIFDETFEFDITGGDGADNQTTPSAFNPVGSGRSILKYDSGKTATVRRIQVGGYRTMLCGFGLEAIADIEDLSTFMETVFEWFESTDIDENSNARPREMIMSVYPNPASRSIRLEMGALIDHNITIRLTDIAGRRVAGLYKGVWKGNVLTIPPTDRGIYFITITADTRVASIPVVLLGD